MEDDEIGDEDVGGDGEQAKTQVLNFLLQQFNRDMFDCICGKCFRLSEMIRMGIAFSDGEPFSGNRCRCVLAILSFIDFRDKECLNRDFPMLYYWEISGWEGEICITNR